ncbi:hypothetical protein OSC27_12575 [Microbacterium sp. STN6]|uniref:hypothetical protein n=1 Tax=Microbacterium sp. STN6 TaxID=2995588 RepID=UPI002260D27B|nr:hypothetical protein [Microbacterium sp. STN6]MCX7523106.1 hypothetical protein [Microbacterium sp. STN6]
MAALAGDTSHAVPVAGTHASAAQASIRLHLGIGLAALALVAGFIIAPTGPAEASTARPQQVGPAQAFTVDANVAVVPVSRDDVSATDGVQALAANATNADWAKMVLMYGGWPQSENNVTVMLRWMRQENGPRSWWLRNNPLNNGYGSGGGGGLGSYPSLVSAAEYAAANLHRGYPAIVAGLASSASPDVTAKAIWASPWSSSHYANGTHWSSAPVEIVKAPASAW